MVLGSSLFNNLTTSGVGASGNGGKDILVLSVQHQGEKSLRGIRGVIHNAGGLVDTALVVGFVNGLYKGLMTFSAVLTTQLAH